MPKNWGDMARGLNNSSGTHAPSCWRREARASDGRPRTLPVDASSGFLKRRGAITLAVLPAERIISSRDRGSLYSFVFRQEGTRMGFHVQHMVLCTSRRLWGHMAVWDSGRVARPTPLAPSYRVGCSRACGG